MITICYDDMIDSFSRLFGMKIGITNDLGHTSVDFNENIESFVSCSKSTDMVTCRICS